jgi:hypothetical protein
VPDAGDEVGAEFLHAAWQLLQEELGWDEPEPRRDEPERRADGHRDKGVRLLASINAGDVAARTSLSSTGGFYKRWPERRRFVEDLTDYVLGARRLAEVGDADVAAFDAALREGRSLPEALEAAARGGLSGLADSPVFAVQVNIWSASRRYPSMRARLRDLYGQVTARWTGRFDTILGLLGWRMRPGLDTATLGVLITALAEGLAMRRAVDGEAANDDVLSAGLQALLLACVDWDGDGLPVGVKLAEVTRVKGAGRGA